MSAACLETSVSLARNLIDPECRLVATMLEEVLGDGATGDPFQVINYYVALKSTPLVIITGPIDLGMHAAVTQFAGALTGRVGGNFQIVEGHAWWAASSPNLVEFTKLQTRFISQKILALLEEAWLPENLNKLYIAFLDRISPAELLGYFCELAAQIQKGMIDHLPAVFLPVAFPYPPNLFFIGTLGAPQFRWYDEEILFAHTTVIPWCKVEKQASHQREFAPPTQQDLQKFFLESRIRRGEAAHRKLRSIPEWQENCLRPLLEIESALVKHAPAYPTRAVTDKALVYLANAWSGERNGLFSPSFARNLEIALDFAIAQETLPLGLSVIQGSGRFNKQLRALLGERFQRSIGFLDELESVEIT